MMKIGILTYHAVNNDGSVLQAFCLQQILRNRLPNAEIEIIDYRSRKMFLSEWKKIIKLKPPFYRQSAWAKMCSLNSFRKKHLNISVNWTVTDREDKAMRFINKQSYDAIFVGSDTVWEARVSPFCPKPINIYYLRNVQNIRKIAFAASADPVQLDFVELFMTGKDVGGVISKFDIITVRDQATHNYLVDQGITEESITHMPDPTLLYDFSELLEPAGLESKKPIAGISCGGREKTKIVAQCKKLGYSIFDFSTMEMDGKGREDLLSSLSKRLGAYRDLDLLITDRFHGSIFATIFGDYPIVFLETERKWPQANSKGRDLYKRLGLERMVHRVEGDELMDGLIPSMLERWNRSGFSRSDVRSRLRALGENGLEKIVSFLNRYPKN